MHGSLLTFGNDSPLYGHPDGGSALTDMCVIHTGHGHKTRLQTRERAEGGSREGACGKQSGGLKGRGARAGRGTFIHPSSFTFSFLVVVCCFEVECSGGARWDTVWLSTVRGEGGGGLHCMPFSLKG